MAEEIRSKYRSIQDIVFTTLRDEIVSHTIKPGEVLNSVELSKRLGVSRTPIREALNRLISIGLVEETPHRSCYVKKISLDQLIEIFYIRAALAGVATRLAATRITELQLGRLSKLCDEMENIEGPEQYKTMLEKNREFHSIIIEAAASPRIAELWEQYYSLSQQYRALALELPGRFDEICSEHRSILGALKDGDKEKAEYHAREHYFNTAEKIAKAFESKAEA